jgi:uncharacterized circularly permuted ATP-grasp superfamily protein
VERHAGLGHAAEYNRLVAEDPAAAVEQAAWLADAFQREGIRFDGSPMSSFLRPHFLPRARWEPLRRDASRLLELAARVARDAFDGDAGRLCDYLGTPPSAARWVSLDPGPPDVLLSRLDAFQTPAGARFIEINSDAPAGFGYGDRMARVFRELPVFRRFAARHAVAYEASAARLVEAVLGIWSRRGDPASPTVAIVDFADVKTRADQEILLREFADAGVRCLLADPRETDVRDGALYAGAERIDLVYRRALLSELLEREAEVGGLFAAYRDGLVPFVNSFRCHLSEDKAFFALLGDEAFGQVMTAEEQAFVRGAVPWTRRIEERRTLRDGREVDLVEHVLERRLELVIKPAHAYGGRSVFIGDETEPGAWEAAVREALGSAWVVQERVAIPEEEFPVVAGGALGFERLKVNTNPFYVAGAQVGAVTRVSRSSVINVSAGGGSVPTFVVD